MKEEEDKNSAAYKRLGVTHAIRDKLNFHDERKWKRFSARRLELIDTLDLSSKKASEQESEISRVAEALRIEFEYSLAYFDEFDRLVRAAIQSVRRNRKRSSKSKRSGDRKIPKRGGSFSHNLLSPEADLENIGDHEDSDNGYPKGKFLSEIAKFTSDSQDDSQNKEYSKTKTITELEKSKDAINSMVQPRIAKVESKVESISEQLPSFRQVSSTASYTELTNLRTVILNYFERSKTCSEAATKHTANLEFLGKGVIIASVGYVFEKSFSNTNEGSLEYLRNRLTQESYLANFYREMDPTSSKSVQLSDEAAVMTLYTLLGACIKDFGFEAIMIPICELFYLTIIKEYPLISQSSVPFKSSDYLSTTGDSDKTKYDSLVQLNSLAAVASDLRQQEQRTFSLPHSLIMSPASSRKSTSEPRSDSKKQVSLRFLSNVLNFTFPSNISATPKLAELLENARSAFRLSLYNDSQVLGLKNTKDGFIIKSDLDLERIFMSEESIELEVFTQKPHAVPIYEITSMVVPNKYRDDPQKIILPPPVTSLTREPMALSNFKFLSNLDEPTPVVAPPTAPLLPKFQPLL